MTTGTRETVTDSVLREIERKIWDANAEMSSRRGDKRDVILSIQRHIGSNSLGDAGGHAGALDIELLENSLRNIPSFTLQKELRARIGTVPGSQKISFGGGRWGKAISISLTSNDLSELDRAKRLLKNRLSEFGSLTDITDSDIEGWREIRLTLTPVAYSLGLTQTDVAGQIRQVFFGDEVQRFQRGEDEIRVWVRYPEKDRSSLGDLEALPIRTRSGKSLPLSAVADYSIQRGRVAIAHINGRREIQVEADQVDPQQSVATLLTQIKREVVPEIKAATRNVHISFEGRERRNRQFTSSLAASFPLALIAIAVILVLVFRSTLQAILIFLMIPLGLLGAVWGHLFHGFMISRLSTFGVIALAGIVINDSIVFIDQINRNLRASMNLKEAIYAAGISRLRPIILTTVTTVAGMAPLILETSRQAQFLIPMAVSLSYGLIFGSLLILFIVPVLFLALNRLRLIGARLSNLAATPESVEPAVRELQSSAEGA